MKKKMFISILSVFFSIVLIFSCLTVNVSATSSSIDVYTAGLHSVIIWDDLNNNGVYDSTEYHGNGYYSTYTGHTYTKESANAHEDHRYVYVKIQYFSSSSNSSLFNYTWDVNANQQVDVYLLETTFHHAKSTHVIYTNDNTDIPDDAAWGYINYYNN